MCCMCHPRRSFLILKAALCIILSGCSLHPLTVQTQYLTHESLASFHVGTPDPSLHSPFIGQRLLVQWSLPASQLEGCQAFLFLKVRFRNHKEDEVKIPLHTKRGTYIYLHSNDDYCTSGGILTYQALIRNQNCILASWKHPLWTELIRLQIEKRP